MLTLTFPVATGYYDNFHFVPIYNVHKYNKLLEMGTIDICVASRNNVCIYMYFDIYVILNIQD